MHAFYFGWKIGEDWSWSKWCSWDSTYFLLLNLAFLFRMNLFDIRLCTWRAKNVHRFLSNTMNASASASIHLLWKGGEKKTAHEKKRKCEKSANRNLICEELQYKIWIWSFFPNAEHSTAQVNSIDCSEHFFLPNGAHQYHVIWLQ